MSLRSICDQAAPPLPTARASVRSRSFPSLRGERSITLRTAVAKELPHFAHFRDHVEVQVRHYDFCFIAARPGNNLSPRIAEITLAIKFPNTPRLLNTNAVNCAHKIAVSHGMRGLLQVPQIFREPGNGCRRIEHNLRAVQSQNARSLRKMPVVANVNADPGIFRFKHRVSAITRSKIKLLPKSRMAMWNMVLAILSKIASVGVDHGGCVEIHSRHLFFVNRNHNHHAMLRCDLLHQAYRRAVRYPLG